MGNSNIAVCDMTGSFKSIMAAAKPDVLHVSACRWNRIKILNSNGYAHVFDNEELKHKSTTTVQCGCKSNKTAAKSEIRHRYIS
jgi:hypothetical protein